MRIEATGGRVSIAWDRQKMQEGLSHTTTALTQVTELVAQVKGRNWRSDKFSDFLKGYEEELVDLHATLHAYEKLYKSFENQKMASIVQEMKQFNEGKWKYLVALQTYKEKKKDYVPSLENVTKELNIEIEKQERNDVVLIARGLFLLLLIGLTVFIGVLAFKSLRAHKLISPS